MRHVEISEQRLILDDFFKVRDAHLKYERYDGTMSPIVRRLSFERGDSVAAIVVNRDRRTVYLTEQFKYPTFGKGNGWIVEVVAGTVEPGETAEVAIAREVLEEIGFAVQTVEPVATFYVSPGGSNERIFLFCTVVSGAARRSDGGGVAAEGEDILTLEWPIANLLSSLDMNQLEDAKTIIAAYWLKENWKRILRN
jgi:ADP-ribose pyrophosphatase